MFTVPTFHFVEHDTLHAESAKIRRFHEDLRVGGPAPVVGELLARVRAWTVAMRGVIQREGTSMSARYAEAFALFTGRPAPKDQRPADQSGGRYWTYRIGAVAALAFETVVAATVASQIFALETVAAASVGVLITLVTAAILKAVCSLAIAPYASHPQRALTQLHRWLRFAFPVWLLTLCATLMFGQLATDWGAASELFFILSRTVLSLASPLIAAILLICSNLAGWSRPYVASDRFLEHLEFEINALEKYSDEVERQMAAFGDAVATSSTRPINSAVVSAAAVAVLVLAMLMPSTASAGEVCGQVWVDYSASPDPHQMALAQQTTVDLMAQAEQTGIYCWELFGFYADPFSARAFHTVRIPKPPTASDCPPPQPPSECGLFRKCRDAAQEKTKASCDENRRLAQTTYQQTLDAELSHAIKVLAKPPMTFAGPCTALVDLLERLATQTTQSAALILSDGEETCDPRRRGQVSVPVGAGKAILLLVSSGSTRRTAGQHVREMQRVWGPRSPWLKVIPPYALEPSAFGPTAPAATRGTAAIGLSPTQSTPRSK